MTTPVKEFNAAEHPAFRFLEIANRHTEVEPLVEEFLAEAGRVSGCSAVGFRIIDEHDMLPYIRSVGFSAEFDRLEGTMDPDKATCFCAQVFNNRVRAPERHRTDYGSLWMDDIAPLFQDGLAGDRGLHTGCYLEGFATLALIPIRTGETTLGLIHLADRERGRVDAGTLMVMEYVARQLGNTLQRIRVEAKLKEHNLLLTEEVKLRSNTLKHSARKLAVERTARQRTEQIANRREAALEGLYDLATRLGNSLEQNAARAVELLAGTVRAVRVVFFCEERGAWNAAASYGPAVVDNDELLALLTAAPLPGTGVCRTVCPGGSATGVPLRNADTDVTGILAVVHGGGTDPDPDDTRVLEIFGHYLAYEIEHRELHTRLLKAREMELLGQLTSGLAHEVRNPLNALVANTEALFQVMEHPEKYEKFVFFIRSQVERLSRLMNDLLEMGRPLQVGNLRAHPAAELVLHAVEAWRNLASVRNVNVETAGFDALEGWAVRADETKIQQVFINLFENAAQLAGEGSVIRLEASLHESAVRYAVIDRGPGIAADLRRRIFEPFYTTRRGGSGLGLAIVRHIVNLHNGTVGVDEAPGGGAMFVISLPGIREDTV